MSHHHVELIMPPTDLGIQEQVGNILYPLSMWVPERAEAEDYLYDWFTIGGRFAGTKLCLRLDPERLRQFWDELHGEAFNTDTDSSIFMGERWWGTSDLPKIDALWRKWFPEDEVGAYPLSPYYPAGDWDICRVDRLPDNLTAHAVVFQIAVEVYDRTKGEWLRTDFDGSVRKALRRCRAGGVEPANDWLAITLDAHNWSQVV